MQLYEQLVVCAATFVLAGVLLFGNTEMLRAIRLPGVLVSNRRWFGALFACAGVAIVASSFLK